MAKKLRGSVLALVVVLSTGCTTLDSDYTLDATRALLQYCMEAPVGEVGATNDTLATAFLQTKDSLLVCKSVSKSIIND